MSTYGHEVPPDRLEPADDRGISRRSLLARGASLGAGALLLGELPSLAAAAPKRGGTLRLGCQGAASGDILDPITSKNNNGGEYVVARWPMLYQRLTRPSANDKLVYELAQDMTPNKNATTWKIRIRDGVLWHDGSPFTAHDVVYSLQYILNPANIATAQQVLASIMKPSGVRALDKTTVEVTLLQPLAILPLSLSAYTIWMIKTGEKYPMSKGIGTGPWMVKQWVAGQRTLLARNPHYWVSGEPYLDEVEVILFSDPAPQLNAFQSGQLDAISQLAASAVKTVKANPAFRVLSHPGGAFACQTMFIDTAPFNDNRVREALRLATNRPQMIANALNGAGVIGNDIQNHFDPDRATPQEIPQRPYDPEKAKSLLKAAGATGLQLDMYTSDAAPGMLESGTLFAAQMAEVGVNVAIKNIPSDSFWTTAWLKQPLESTYWGSRTLDQFIAVSMTKGAPNNETHWTNPTFTKLWMQYRAQVNAAKRHELSVELQRMLWNDGGYIIWGFQDFLDAYTSKLRGITGGSERNFNMYNFNTTYFA
jgi:peptide/nickel transport system substrate-binding protein